MTTPNELYHYGVLGMKWGVRRTPEQLGHKKKSWKASKGTIGAKPIKYHSPAFKKAIQTAADTAYRLADTLDPTGMFALIYTARAVSKNSDYFYTNEQWIEYDGPIEKLKDIRRKETTNTSILKDAAIVNKGFSEGRKNNCMCCVTALEMRQRGYDVQARRRSYGYVTEAYKSWFDGLEINKSKTTRLPDEKRKSFVERGYKNLTDQLEKYPDGSRGFVAFDYEGSSSGHTISWRVQNGTVKFYDAQTGKEGVDKALSFSDQNYEWGRLDNLTIKPEIAETVVSRKGKS